MMKRFAVGEPISGWPVETWNGLVDSQADMDALTELIRGTLSAPPTSSHASTVLVVNKTGVDVHEFDVLGIDVSAMTVPAATTADEVILSGVSVEGIEPDIELHRNAYVITLQPIAADDTGHAVIAGVTWARVDIGDADHACAALIDATVDNLASAPAGGVPILYKPAGTGVKWCIVRLGAGPVRKVIAQVNGDVEDTDAEFPVDNVQGLDGNYAGDTIDDVQNDIGGSWADDDWIIAVYDEVDNDWQATGGGNSGKVKVNVDDDLDYLEDQFIPVATYDATHDLSISTDTVADSGDDKVRPFIDASGISGHSTTGFRVLCKDGDTWKSCPLVM